MTQVNFPVYGIFPDLADRKKYDKIRPFKGEGWKTKGFWKQMGYRNEKMDVFVSAGGRIDGVPAL